MGLRDIRYSEGVIEKRSNVVDECFETEVDATGWCHGLAVNGVSWWIPENDSFEEGDVGFCFGRCSGVNKPIITDVESDQARIVTPLGMFNSCRMKERKEWISAMRMSYSSLAGMHNSVEVRGEEPWRPRWVIAIALTFAGHLSSILL